ncbi:MAG: hypothetical protein HYW25_03860 [Candidatus Aenigmarchaeota archaeon]|nr:hypothetical protein [Candidatus Aenigmarchaeota archaeon]
MAGNVSLKELARSHSRTVEELLDGFERNEQERGTERYLAEVFHLSSELGRIFSIEELLLHEGTKKRLDDIFENRIMDRLREISLSDDHRHLEKLDLISLRLSKVRGCMASSKVVQLNGDRGHHYSKIHRGHKEEGSVEPYSHRAGKSAQSVRPKKRGIFKPFLEVAAYAATAGFLTFFGSPDFTKTDLLPRNQTVVYEINMESLDEPGKTRAHGAGREESEEDFSLKDETGGAEQPKMPLGYKISKEPYARAAAKGGLYGIAKEAGIDPQAFIRFFNETHKERFGTDRDTMGYVDGRIHEGPDGIGPDKWSWEEMGNEIFIPAGAMAGLNPDISRLQPVYGSAATEAAQKSEARAEEKPEGTPKPSGPPGDGGGNAEGAKQAIGMQEASGRVMKFTSPAPEADKNPAELSPSHPYASRVVRSFIGYFEKTGSPERALDYLLMSEPGLDKNTACNMLDGTRKRITNIVKSTEDYIAGSDLRDAERAEIYRSQRRKIENIIGRSFAADEELQRAAEAIAYAPILQATPARTILAKAA